MRTHESQHSRPPCSSLTPGVKPNSCSLSVMPSKHVMLCHPLLLLPSIFPSIRVFSNESALCIRWPKYWSFSFNISASNEHPELSSIRMDWLDLLAVQGTYKSLLQNHSSKASILWCSAFFTVQHSHPYMTTGKTIALTAAKSLQSCPTLCNPRDGSPPGSHPWDSPGKNTGVGCHFLLQCMKVKVKSLSRVRLLATPWTAAHQAPPSMGFSRQEYWSEVPLPSPEKALLGCKTGHNTL